MAKIIRNVEDINNITVKNLLIELEEIQFVDDTGKTKTFKLNSIIPISTERCEQLDDNVDWDKNNFHFIACTGDAVI